PAYNAWTRAAGATVSFRDARRSLMSARGWALFRSGALVALLLLLGGGPSARAQDDEAPSQGKNKPHYPLAEELGSLLEGAARAAKEGDHERACDLFRTVLDQDQRPGRPG